jgi:undecaprenyl diphosphate synthase
LSSFEAKQKHTAERLGIPVEHVPRHVAIIMDGNGRWAQSRGLPRAEGHRQGGKTVERIAQCAVDLGIETLTLYSFSTENWKRPKGEIDGLMFLYKQYLVRIRPTLMKNNVKLIHLGRQDPLPADVVKALGETVEQTAGNTGMVLALALNYSGRAELVDAIRAIAEQCTEGSLRTAQIDEQCVARHLYAPQLKEPDLLIRAANERRVSNFLLWQISYSEFYITEALWPDFSEDDMDKAILDYAHRVRRFGDVKAAGK